MNYLPVTFYITFLLELSYNKLTKFLGLFASSICPYIVRGELTSFPKSFLNCMARKDICGK